MYGGLLGRGVLWAACVSLFSIPTMAQTPAAPMKAAAGSEAVPGLTLTECVVYTLDKSTSVDCLEKARAACADGIIRCELPIGYALTDGRDLDGNRRTWEKVRVRFKCGSKVVTRGPHFQSDHAAMVLTCQRAA